MMNMKQRKTRWLSASGAHLAHEKRKGAGRSSPARRTACTVAACLCAAVFILSSAMACVTYLRSRAEQASFDELAAGVDSAEPRASDSRPEQSLPEAADDGPGTPQEQNEPMQRTEYYPLYEQNPDFACWLEIPNTEIDYPVMSTPDDPEYYIDRAFDGSDSISGTPFIGDGVSADSDCFIIYAHNMKNGTMFGTLARYADAAFQAETPGFTVTTPYETRMFEVFAAVKTRVLYADEDGFRYYDQSGGLTEDTFAALTDWLTENALYDTGVRPVYGDQIVLLSTCSYHTENGRFVVAARCVRTDG